jgi:hypothetical protein
MRLVVDYNIDAEPNLSTIFCEYNLLEKSGAVTLTYNGAGEITTYDLSQNYPNPFNPTTNIKFSIPRQDYVKLAVYNLLGEVIAILVDEVLQAGNHNVPFQADNLSSGVYIYRIESENFVQSNKMILLK